MKTVSDFWPTHHNLILNLPLEVFWSFGIESEAKTYSHDSNLTGNKDFPGNKIERKSWFFSEEPYS